MGLGQFDEAEDCFELLRSMGQGSTADCYLKKVYDAKRNHQIVANQIAYSANQNEADSEPLNKTTNLISLLETQARETEIEAVQKSVFQPNSRTEFRNSLSAYLIIAIGTLFISIYLNWQFKNQIRY